jgi:hypothetical protein
MLPPPLQHQVTADRVCMCRCCSSFFLSAAVVSAIHQLGSVELVLLKFSYWSDSRTVGPWLLAHFPRWSLRQSESTKGGQEVLLYSLDLSSV